MNFIYRCMFSSFSQLGSLAKAKAPDASNVWHHQQVATGAVFTNFFISSMFVGYLRNTAIYGEDISVCREVIVSTDVGIKLEDPFQISLGSCPVKDGI